MYQNLGPCPKPSCFCLKSNLDNKDIIIEIKIGEQEINLFCVGWEHDNVALSASNNLMRRDSTESAYF